MCLKVDGRGRRFAQMLHDDVFSPLGMTDTNLGVRDDLLPRLCPVRVANPPPVDPFPLEPFAEHVILAPGGEIPSAGGLTTISDLHRFAEMLRRGGEIDGVRSEEHTSELQSLMRNSYAVFCLKKKKTEIKK